ncbi:hypothetical protein NC796_22470 [Aliifodinibius sp. S!AR15-10]|nr:hypothetical protein [Aliifodinibius sp. S!AR15-10]
MLTIIFFCLLTFLSACSDSPISPDASDQELDRIIDEGLEAWRKPGAIQEGAACANCHAPDALDLAYFDFSSNTLKRRAEPHVSQFSSQLSANDFKKIKKLVEAQRIKYGIQPKDPMEFRPLQPGGEVLPGNTAAERDHAFGRQLRDMEFAATTDTVLSLEDAKQHRDAWLQVNPRRLKIGIPFNRWSEDPHHGTEHATMADWLPDLPRIPREGRAGEWYALQDAYLDNPTDENFWEMYSNVHRYTQSIFDGRSEHFFHRKYRSVLMAQHIFRKELMGQEEFPDRPSLAWFPTRSDDIDNPIWDIGLTAHGLRNGPDDEEDFEMPPDVLLRSKPSGSIKEQMDDIRVPWFYAGWLFDQGLQHSGGSSATTQARYFTLHMHIDDGYPIHNAFAITRKLIVENFDTEIHQEEKPINANYENFSNRAHRHQPGNENAREIYRLMTLNSYRMMALFVQDYIANKGIPSGSEEAEERVAHWQETLDHFERFTEEVQGPNHTYNLQLISDVRIAILEG